MSQSLKRSATMDTGKRPTKRRKTENAFAGKHGEGKAYVRKPNPVVEVKYFGYNGSGYAGTVNGTSSLQLISDIPQGDTPRARDGNAVRFKGIQYGYLGDKPSSVGCAVVRLVIFRWNQGYRAPITADILNAPSTLSYYNHNTTKNYKILVDRLIKFTGEATTASTFRPDTQVVKGFVNDDKICTWETDGTTTADTKIYAFFCNDLAGSTTNYLFTELLFTEL